MIAPRGAGRTSGYSTNVIRNSSSPGDELSPGPSSRETVTTPSAKSRLVSTTSPVSAYAHWLHAATHGSPGAPVRLRVQDAAAVRRRALLVELPLRHQPEARVALQDRDAALRGAELQRPLADELLALRRVERRVLVEDRQDVAVPDHASRIDRRDLPEEARALEARLDRGEERRVARQHRRLRAAFRARDRASDRRGLRLACLAAVRARPAPGRPLVVVDEVHRDPPSSGSTRETVVVKTVSRFPAGASGSQRNIRSPRITTPA